MIEGDSLTADDLALVLAKISLYASADLSEASMLGLVSAETWDHFDGDEDPDLSIAERGLLGFCAIEEGFLLNTLRDDFPFSSGAVLGFTVFADGLPNPKLDPFDFDSSAGLGAGD
jgi:hypothetical protein